MEPTRMRAHKLFYGAGGTAIKPRKIHADNCIGLPIQGETIKPVQKSTKFGQVLQDVGNACDGMAGHIKSKFNSGRCHFRTACSKEARLDAGVERLEIRRGN